MNRAPLLWVLLLLAVLGGTAWMLRPSPSAPNGDDPESVFDLDETEELPEPGTALAASELERSAALDEPAATPTDEALAALAAQTSFDHPTLRGRRVDAQGQPLPADPLYVLEIGARQSRGNFIRKDALGVFHFILIPEAEVEPGSWICLQHQGPGTAEAPGPAPETYVLARAVDPVTRMQDAGDLVSGRGPTALAGIVMDLDRRPLAGAKVEVAWSPAGKDHANTVFHTLTGADGRFLLLGSWPDVGKWTVKGSHPDHLPVTLPTAPGSAKVELLLPRGSALRGQILVDPEISLERLGLKIRARRDGNSRWEQNFNLKPDPKTGEFAATGLVNGWGRIRVFDNQMKWNLHFQYGIPLPSGLDAQVPELQPLDLRGRLKNFKLTALQPDGSLAQELKIVVREKKGPRQFGIPNPLECVVPSATIEITVIAKDCSEQTVFLNGAEQTIRLLPCPRIVFQADRLPALEEGFSLNFAVRGEDGTVGHWQLKLDANGAAELALTPGQYTLSAQLMAKRGKNHSVGTSLPLDSDGKGDLRFVVGQDGSPRRISFGLDPEILRAKVEQMKTVDPR